MSALPQALISGEHVPAALALVEVETESGPMRMETFWSAGPVLFVFLRHFGCVGCSEQMTDLAPRLRHFESAGVTVVLVGNGPKEHIAAFVERHALGDKPVTIVTDATLRVFRAAGLIRSWWATYGLRAMVDLARAMGNGHPHLPPDGDPIQQGGALLVDARGMVHRWHRNASVGDHLAADVLVEAALRLAVRSARVRV